MSVVKKLQNKKYRNILLILTLLVATLSLSFATNWTGSFTVRNTGQISMSVVARSGSAPDIQVAVDTVNAVGGGDVLIPAGNFTFNIDYAHHGVDNHPCGVYLYGGVNLIGVGNNQTILYVPLTGWKAVDSPTTIPQRMVDVDGSNGKPVRISGIMFQGTVNMTAGVTDNYQALGAICMHGVKDYRIDHCTFVDFTNFAIGTDANYMPYTEWNMGVIDHNIIDNPYKDIFWNYTGVFPAWGYGIITGGNYYNWKTDEDFFMGQYTNNTCYIEYNSFRRCRHPIAASASAGWYVARFNNFTDNILEYLGSMADVHGGGRGCEIYNNTFTNVACDYRSISQPGYWGLYMGAAIGLRGGAGVIFNNTFINFDVTAAVVLTNDQSSHSDWRLHNVWIWDNTFINVTTQLGISPNAYTITEGVDYFLYAKPGYVAYTYPHPLTLQGT